jgi:hypothetical protein
MVGGTWLQALQAFYDTVGAILEAGEGGSDAALTSSRSSWRSWRPRASALGRPSRLPPRPPGRASTWTAPGTSTGRSWGPSPPSSGWPCPPPRCAPPPPPPPLTAVAPPPQPTVSSEPQDPMEAGTAQAMHAAHAQERSAHRGPDSRSPGGGTTTASLQTPNGGRIAAAGGPPRPFAAGSVSVAGPAQVLAPTHTNTFARTRLEWLRQQEFPMFMSFHMQQGVPERDARMMWDAYEHRCMSA